MSQRVFLFILSQSRISNDCEQSFDEKKTKYSFAVEDVQFGYDCVICSERYSSRSERNEHLESHFIHKKCADCDRLVIIIGDLEFELHRPAYCTAIKHNESKLEKKQQPFVALEKLEVKITEQLLTDENNDEEMREDTKSIDYSEVHLIEETLRAEEDEEKQVEDDPCEEDEPKPKPKSSTGKRTRKKLLRNVKKDNDDKPTKGNSKTRPIKMIACTQDGCSEEFRQQQLLRKHLKTVHGIVEKHLCSICNFSFADKSNLKHHMVTHTDNKRFICSFCGARFHKLTNMTEHMNAHLGLKPYKCEICGKDFGRANHKRQHMRVIYKYYMIRYSM